MVNALKRLSRKGYVNNIPVLSELSENLKSSLKGISEFANAPSRVDMRSSTVFAPNTDVNQSDKWYSSITEDFYDTQDEAILKEYDFKSSGVGKLAEQILDQPYLGQWTLSDDLYGRTVRSLANEFASKLNAQNITDLNQLGTRDGVLINKQTGEEVTGLSNIGRSTSINFAYDASGKPILYTQYIPEPEEDNFFADIAPFLGLGLMFIPGLQGVGASIGAALAPTAGVAAQAAIGNAIVQGAMAEATGGDFLKGAALSGVSSLAGGLQPGLSETLGGGTVGNIASNALIGGTMAELSGGDFAKGALLSGVQSGINQAKLSVAEDYLRSLPSGYGDFPAPTEQDVLDYIAAESPTVTISDTTFKPDYSLSVGAPVIPEMGAQGVQVPTINEVIDVLGGVDYSLPAPSSGLGLVMPTAPNLDSMGGGQGITVPVAGGTLTEAGVIPESYTPVLGDPNSFINQPAPDSGVTIAEPEETAPKDISKELAALDAAKALAPLAVGALTAGALVNKISDGQTQTGFPIVPIPSTWKSPEYDMAFMPSTPIDFGSSALLRGTQWEIPVNLSALINTLNQPIISPETFQMMTHFQAPQVPYETGITDIIGEIGGQPVSIADIISGIQSGQNYSS